MTSPNHFLSFSKRERTGIIVLVIIILVIFLVPEFIPVKKPTINMEAALEFQKQVASLKMNEIDSGAIYEGETSRPPSYFNNKKKERKLFHFDPNTISTDDWKSLGVTDRTAQTIKKFIAKGGRFRKPEDLGKIYGLPKKQYHKLLPFVEIPPDIQKKLPPVLRTSDYKQSFERSVTIIDINEADTTAFIALPGIGNKLAQRITAFRQKLGGFHSVDQLKETYGLQDSIFQKILPFLQCNASQIRQININTAEEATLRSHPYFKWNIANAIVKYREQHGEYKSLEDLMKINIISVEAFQKLAPYCSVK